MWMDIDQSAATMTSANSSNQTHGALTTYAITWLLFMYASPGHHLFQVCNSTVLYNKYS